MDINSKMYGKEFTTGAAIVVILLVLVIIYGFSRCTLRCAAVPAKNQEGWSNRLAATHSLADTAYTNRPYQGTAMDIKYKMPTLKEVEKALNMTPGNWGQLPEDDVPFDVFKGHGGWLPGGKGPRDVGQQVWRIPAAYNESFPQQVHPSALPYEDHGPEPPLFKKKENFTLMRTCNDQCKYETNFNYSKCMNACVRRQAFIDEAQNQMRKQGCTKNTDCTPDELCVMHGPYTGGGPGMCMNVEHPGAPAPPRLPMVGSRPYRGAGPVKPSLPSLPHMPYRGAGPARPSLPSLPHMPYRGAGPVKPSLPSLPSRMPVMQPGPVLPSSIREGFNFPHVKHDPLSAKSCPALHSYNYYSGHCEPMFQGPWIANQAPDPEVSIPGTVLPGYGVGTRDPRNLPTNYTVTTQ